MAHVIIKSDERREDEERVANSFDYDHSDPAMREAVEIIAARNREALDSQRRD